MRNPFIRLAIAILVPIGMLFMSVAYGVEFREAPTSIPDDPTKLVGTHIGPEHPRFPGWLAIMGQLIDDHQAVEFLESGTNGDLVLMALWALPSAPGESLPNWLVTGAVRLPPLGEGQYVLGFCQTDNFQVAQPVAIGGNSDGETYELASAWLVFKRTGVIAEANTDEVVCFDEGGSGD
jgi:hypothetical protein